MIASIYNRHFHWIVALSSALFLCIFVFPLADLVKFAIHPDHSKFNSYVVFIPFISGYLIFMRQRQITENRSFFPAVGMPVVIAGLLLYTATTYARSVMNPADWISGRTLSLVVCGIGGFLLLFGPRSFRIALFPLAFLLFLVPIPTVLMENLSRFLQLASANVTHILFQVTGVPVLREGFTFHLPRLSIFIAPECSGMRATITLFVLSVLAGHLFLRSGWRKLAATASIFPITIVGNSIRIVALTFMAVYVNPAFLVSDNMLHERGGWLLFGVDLVLLGMVIALLRRNDTEAVDASPAEIAGMRRGVGH